ncbi:MAG TPA: PIN domain-containing protein [Nostocaceae cyanobacterium]|nr:PIN domain-containing protein [Nostocaceae cyanobacterium]
MKVLVDADLLLEALMNRSKNGVNTRELLNIDNSGIQLYLTDLGWQKIYAYTSRFHNDKINATVVNILQNKFYICSVDCEVLQTACSLWQLDFESSVELACVTKQKLNAIVTHKPEDFAAVTNQFQVWSLIDLLHRSHLEVQLT